MRSLGGAYSVRHRHNVTQNIVVPYQQVKYEWDVKTAELYVIDISVVALLHSFKAISEERLKQFY